MLPRWIALLPFCFLTLSCQPPSPSSPQHIRIPLLGNANANTWPDEAYQVEVLNPQPSNQPPNASRLAIAWEPNGLRLWAEVKDASPLEGKDGSLWTGDSLELFVASPYGSENWIQLISSPGRTPEHPRPRSTYLDRQKNGPLLEDPMIKTTPQDQGYLISVLFPWSNLIQPPKEGDIIGVQIYLNDASAAEGKTRLIWFPSLDNQGNPKNYYPLQLARQASSPHQAVASLEIEKLSGVAVKITASPDLAGQPIELRLFPGESWIRLGRLPPAGNSLCLASLPLPNYRPALSGQKAELKVGGILLPPLEIPNVREARLRVLRDCEVLAKPSVFNGPALPAVGFKNQALVDAVFGPCTVSVRYFDAAFSEVLSAMTPGRYGALVEINTADGLTDRRKITLFRSPRPLLPKTDAYEPGRFPQAFGFSAELLHREQQALDKNFNSQLQDLSLSHKDWAVLLAGLSDLGAPAREWHGFDIWKINSEWWHGLEKKIGLAQPYSYLLTLPPDYDADPTQTWPLLVFLHGAGERGSDLNRVKIHGPPKMIAAGKTFPFIVLSPQCPEGEGWSALKVNDCVDQVVAKYRIDPNRIVVTGLSMGGTGCLNLAAQYPGKYAAIAPICGYAPSALAPRLKTTPIWAFNGEKDTSAPPEFLQALVDATNRAGGKARITIYPNRGHNAWDPAYDDPQLYEWFLRQKK